MPSSAPDQKPEQPGAAFWRLVAAARAAGGSKLHLRAGAPPLVRKVTGDLQPLDESLPPLAQGSLMRDLSVLIAPEDWQSIERAGEGETLAHDPATRVTARVALFLAHGEWVVVVHL